MDNNFDEALEPVAVIEDSYPVATEDYVELTEADDSLGVKIAKISIAALTAVLTFIGGLTVVKCIRNKIKAKKEAKKNQPAIEAKATPVEQTSDTKEETKTETPAITEVKPETK